MASAYYKCEFIDTIPEELYCKMCTLVARRLTITDCCGESFCQTCIVDAQEQGLPCPECKEEEFSTFKHVKNQKLINGLHVYCCMKERGCAWSGTLDQLDTHLDPHLDNCQYIDTTCPLNCFETIPKNRVDQHVAQQCSKRPHVCQHCGFKATYEEIVDTHFLKCKYVALQCPNMCGVSCEREVMEDHMKICRLEEVECEFSSVGCDSWFIREDQDEHARQNSQKHLTLIASLAIETKEQLQQKLLQQDKKHKEEEEKILQVVDIHVKKLVKQEKKVREQDQKLKKQEKKLLEQEKKLVEQEKKLVEKEKMIIDLKQAHQDALKSFNSKLKMFKQTQLDMLAFVFSNSKFVMKNFSIEKVKDKPGTWKSPAMYTHTDGYKFCIGINANGTDYNRGKGIDGNIYVMQGEFDEQLKWPADVEFTVEALGAQSSTVCNGRWTWDKPAIPRSRPGTLWQSSNYIPHSELHNFLVNDTLYFQVSKVFVKSK